MTQDRRTETVEFEVEVPDQDQDSTGESTLRNCLSCGTRPTLERSWGEEYENALPVTLYGGYGMFFDDLEEPAKHFVLCHDCAHRIFDANPWLRTIFEPTRSHSHTEEYATAHPEHYGWDYDERAERAQEND